jgi:O-antigen/teichoic acid export membrane protein
MIQKILSDISVYGFGNIFSKGLIFITIIVYSHFINILEMGIYGLLLLFSSLLAIVVNLGSDGAYTRYYFAEESISYKKQLTSTWLYSLTIWMIFIGCCISFLSSSFFVLLKVNTLYYEIFLIAIPAFLLRQYSTMINQIFRNQYKSKQFIFFNVMTAVATLGLALVFFTVFQMGFISIFFAMLITDIVIVIGKFFLFFSLLEGSIDLKILFSLLRYGIPLIPTALLFWVISATDRIALEHLSDLESVGLYTLGINISLILSIISNAIAQAWVPHVYELYNKDPEKAVAIYAKFFNIITLSASLLYFIFVLIGCDIISLVIDEKYVSLLTWIPILLIGGIFQITTQVTALGIYLKNKTIYLVFIMAFVVVVNIVLNYVLISMFNIIGAAIATTLAYLLLTCIYVNVANRLVKIDYDRSVVFSVFILILLGVLIQVMNVHIEYRISLFFLILFIIGYKREKLLQYIKS